MDKVSDTPRTNFVAHATGDSEWDRSINRFGRMMAHACILERELTAQKEHYRVLEDEMLVLGDERSAAVLDAKENMEIANEFKCLMEEYRQRAEAAYKQSHMDAERYRWLRERHENTIIDIYNSISPAMKPELLDAAIDAAMKEMK